ncbi:MAG: rhodanese-like domain-containing protein [Sulfuricurvum sp.]|uniref:rhodanese-like domain-containing protein n=1 Tax=Sulfuricurvum sp. TaxID=2025608 RepID=UPI0027338462|nr:rhodanese-like domain-containing protein [Sulfuricurvum sp.]MDP2850326.1 rhodanese-like domain-containing protein [Sulfuricurvum sp.]
MDKKRLLNLGYWILFIGILGYAAYTKGWILTNFESISPAQAQEMIQKGEKVTLLDVRTPDEFTKEHIDGSILIPLQTLSNNLALIANVKNQKILVYCHSGNRSIAASRLLVENGFTPLNIKGGITEWKAQGLPVTQ